MSVANDDGRRYIPEVVVAAIRLARSCRNAPAQHGVAFFAVFQSVGMHPMKFGADVLPTGTDKHFPPIINNSDPNIGDLVKVIHHGLQGRGVDDISKVQCTDISLWFKNDLQLFPNGCLAFTARFLGLFQLGNIQAMTDITGEDTFAVVTRTAIIK